MSMITTGKAPHRNDHPVLPSMADRTWQSRSMSNMPAYKPEQWHPSGEAERIVPQRDVFRKTNVVRPHTPDMLSMQLAKSFTVGLEEKHGRPAWVHGSSNPNMIAGDRNHVQGVTGERLRVLKRRLLAAAYGRGDVEDTSDDWEELFKLYDGDGSGDLDFDEFKQVIRKHGRVSVRDINDMELRQVFAMIDADGSGEIDGKEFGEFLLAPVIEKAESEGSKSFRPPKQQSASSVMLRSLRSMDASSASADVTFGGTTSGRVPTPAEAKAKAATFNDVDQAMAEISFKKPTRNSRPMILPSKKGFVRPGVSVDRNLMRTRGPNVTMLGPLQSVSPALELNRRARASIPKKKEGAAHWGWPWTE